MMGTHSDPATEPSMAVAMTPAQRLMALHAETQAHQPTVEDVVDEEDLTRPPPSSLPPSNQVAQHTGTPVAMSSKAAGKQRAPETFATSNNASAANARVQLDMQSEEAFPSLGAPKTKNAAASAWSSKPKSVANSNGVNGASSSDDGNPGIMTPKSAGFGPRVVPSAREAAIPMVIPGRHTQDMRIETTQLKSKADLKKPIPELLRDLNKRSKAKVEMKSGPGVVIFTGQGPSSELVVQALKDVAAEVSAKQTVKIPIPASLRPQIIGKQGATIQSIIKKSGARVQMPRMENLPADLDDDSMIDIEIEGDPVSAEIARREIDAIVKQRSSNVNLKLRDIPPELYPFLAGPRNSRLGSLEQSRGVRVRIPQYHNWLAGPPSATPQGFRPQDGYHIQVSGDREAARQAQADIEQQVRDLMQSLTLNKLPIEQARHQFIVGDRGGSLHDFLEETGCSIIMPPASQDDEMLYIVGPPSQIEGGVNKAIDLASSMSMATVDVSRQHAGGHNHSADLARYLKRRQAFQQFEDQYNAHIVLPSTPDNSVPWHIYAKEGRDTMRARGDILNLVNGHPPSRFRGVDIHPFFQQKLEQQQAQAIRDQFGVHVMFPEQVDDSPRVLLVYEGQEPASQYTFPRSQPSPAEVAEFEEALESAEQFLLGSIDDHGDIVQRSVPAPVKYREKIQKYLAREEQREPQPAFPVQFTGLRGAIGSSSKSSTADFPVDFRGPTDAVDDYEQKILAFIQEQIRDDAERDYTTSCDFPQKFANFLIGKRGENINRLRDEFDVYIQVNDGKVDIKGPKAKADAARAHVISMAKKLEDETTHVLKISPQYHRDLIGGKGSQVLRLQERYNVHINFPRSSASFNDNQSVAEDASEAGRVPRKRNSNKASDEVIIKGPRRGADEAREELLNLYQYIQNNSHTTTISVAQAQVPSLIGQGGHELDNMRLSTGAQIDIPGSRDSAGTADSRVEVKIKGTKEQVQAAKKLLEAKVKIFESSVSRTLEVDKQFHRAIIGGGGDNLRNIIAEAGGPTDARERARMVQFPRAESDTNTVRIEGDEAIVAKIVAAIQSFVSFRENQINEIVDVAPARHGLLIGRGGETRKGLEKEFNVTISVPSTSATGAARSGIKITGATEEVARAKQRIQTMVQEPAGETIIVPQYLHHVIAESSNGNLFRNLSRTFHVTIDHAGQQRPAKPAAAGPRPRASVHGNLPLITDDADDGDDPDVTSKHVWELEDLMASMDGVDTEATIPWVFKGSDAANVAKARQMVAQALNEAQQSVTGYLVLPDPKTYRFVIGQGGSTVNRIRRETGCKIEVPKNGSAGEAIEIRGSKAAVEQAKDMVLEAVITGVAGGRR